MSLIKSSAEIKTLRIAGRKLGSVLSRAAAKVEPGMSLLELDAEIRAMILAEHATPSFLGFEGFPKSSCLSLNEQVVHGIPDDRKVREGDLLGIDVGLWYDGLCVDAAVTVGVGTVGQAEQELLAHTQEALKAGIKAVRPFKRVGAISHAVQSVAEKYGHGIVRTLTGHGVGHQVHEDPEIPNFGHPTDGIFLKPGMVLAIEPMFTLGGGEVHTQVDGWGIVTADKSMAAQFEHTVVVTAKGAEILTIPS